MTYKLVRSGADSNRGVGAKGEGKVESAVENQFMINIEGAGHDIVKSAAECLPRDGEKLPNYGFMWV